MEQCLALELFKHCLEADPKSANELAQQSLVLQSAKIAYEDREREEAARKSQSIGPVDELKALKEYPDLYAEYMAKIQEKNRVRAGAMGDDLKKIEEKARQAPTINVHISKEGNSSSTSSSTASETVEKTTREANFQSTPSKKKPENEAIGEETSTFQSASELPTTSVNDKVLQYINNN